MNIKDYTIWSKSTLPSSVHNSMMSLNSPYNDVFDKLLLNRILFLSGEINLYTSEIIKSQMLYLENLDSKKDITIYINSPGGSVYDGLGIVDIMDHVSPDVSTVNTGLAASMGAIILCSGANGKRKALKRSRTMIHQPLSFGYAQQASDMEIEVRQINHLKKDLCEIIANKTGNSYKKVFKDCDRDYWLSAKDSLKYGMIDKIVK